MYRVELTKGSGWNPAVVETHSVEKPIHLAEVERMAQKLFATAWRKSLGPDGYRIRDALGRVVKVGP
jgi:hypothetical protein